MEVDSPEGGHHQTMVEQPAGQGLPHRVGQHGPPCHAGGTSAVAGDLRPQHPQLRDIPLTGLARHGRGVLRRPAVLPERQLHRKGAADLQERVRRQCRGGKGTGIREKQIAMDVGAGRVGEFSLTDRSGFPDQPLHGDASFRQTSGAVTATATSPSGPRTPTLTAATPRSSRRR